MSFNLEQSLSPNFDTVEELGSHLSGVPGFGRWCHLAMGYRLFWQAPHGMGFPRDLSGKESACQCSTLGLDLGVRKIPWGRKWEATPVFLPGKFYRQRSLVGCSPWVTKRHDWAAEHASRHSPGGLCGQFFSQGWCSGHCVSLSAINK